MTFEPKDNKTLRGYTAEQMAAEVKAASHELYVEAQKRAAGELKDTTKIRVLRRYVARAKTVANELQK